MAAMSIRDLDDEVRDRLRVRAAANGRSMEAEVRAILTEAVSDPSDPRGLFVTLIDSFRELGGVDLDLPPRNTPVRAADLPS
jgi:plasmid stability protein